MKVSLDWLRDYVKVRGTVRDLAECLTNIGLHVEGLKSVSGDSVLEIEVTTNRPDWLSHIGVARELHAVTGRSFSTPRLAKRKTSKTMRSFKISIPDLKVCPYYSAVLLEDVEWGKTPEFMKCRLEACGIRSVNLIVDITNFVLLECGQPLHAFDADRLRGSSVQARLARDGETLLAIDGSQYKLVTSDIVIADSGGPIAVGGVMGGRGSEVDQTTKNILIESAFFLPSAIRATSRRLGLGSESSYRFERRVDPCGVDWARERARDLIFKYAKVARTSPVFHAGRLPIQESKIALQLSEVKRVLGVEIPNAPALLTRLGLRVRKNRKTLLVQAPSFRSDLTRPADLIEELARLHGYDKIPGTLPSMEPIEQKASTIFELEYFVRDICASLGCHEAVSFSLVDPAPFERLGLMEGQWTRLVNPQNQELNLMRPNLLSGLLEAVRRNFYVGEGEIALFELGSRYIDQGGNRYPLEEPMVAIVFAGDRSPHWIDAGRPIGFYDLKGVIEELLNRIGLINVEFQEQDGPIYRAGEARAVRLGNEVVGSYGTLSDRVRGVYDIKKPVFYAELSLGKINPHWKRGTSVSEISKYPVSPRDLTLILDETIQSRVITNRIREMAGELAARIDVVDLFKGGSVPKGKKSLSFRISYQAKDRTLQNEEVNRLHFSIIDSLRDSFRAELPKGKDG